MNIRKLLFCMVIPGASSFLAGSWFTLHGVTNLGITVLLAIVALCAAWGYYVKGPKLAFSTFEWLLETITGFLYIKLLAGLLGEFGVLIYVLVLALFTLMVIFTINHVKHVVEVAGMRKTARRKRSAVAPVNEPQQASDEPEQSQEPDSEETNKK